MDKTVQLVMVVVVVILIAGIVAAIFIGQVYGDGDGGEDSLNGFVSGIFEDAQEKRAAQGECLNNAQCSSGEICNTYTNECISSDNECGGCPEGERCVTREGLQDDFPSLSEEDFTFEGPTCSGEF